MNDNKRISQKVFSCTLLVVFAVFLLLGASGSALAAKGIIINTGTGGSSGKMSVSDLGITDVGMLPSSKWYFTKEMRRGFERFFTFNSVGKTELELRITNEKAAEALTIQETTPDDSNALLSALENYTKAQERLAHRLISIKETSENPNVEKLLEKLDEQNVKHALLLEQLAERWDTDPYVEDANIVNPRATRDNHLQGAVDSAQKQIQGTVITASAKEKHIEEKAAEAIKRAEITLSELESQLGELIPSGAGVQNARTGPIRLDPTPARISTNMTIERQTPKRDFGDRMKAGLETAGGVLANGKQHLDRAKSAFAEQKFGEAFGEARSGEVLAINGSRIVNSILRADTGGLEDGIKTGVSRAGSDADAPRIEDMNSAIPAPEHSNLETVTKETTLQRPQEVLPLPRAKPAVVINPPAVSAPADKTQEALVIPTSVPTLSSTPPPQLKAAPSLGELTTYTHPLYSFSFNYPKTWNKIANTPSDSNSLSFSRYPQNSESLEIHMTVGEKLNMEQVVASDAVDHKKEMIIVAGTSIQKLTFEQYDRHGGSLGFMREIHIAVPLPSGKFLNLLGVCSTVGSSYDGRCTTAIDDIMNTVIIPSVKI